MMISSGKAAKAGAALAIATALMATGGTASATGHSSGKESSSVTTTTVGSYSLGHGKTTVSLWDGITGPNEPSFLTWLKSTTAPVTLQAQELPWSVIYEKLPAAMASGQPPDLLMLHPYDMLAYAQHGDLIPLTSFAKSFVPKGVLNSSVWKANTYKGMQYAIPIGTWDELFYYNKTLWAKAGFPQGPPLDNPTLLLKALKKLTVSRGGKVDQWGLGVSDGNIHRFYELLMMQIGAPLFTGNGIDLTSPASLRVLKYMRSLVETMHVEANPAGLVPDALLEQGKLALYVTGQWHNEEFTTYTAQGGKLKWAITSKPVVMIPGGKQVTLAGGPAFAITKAAGGSSSRLVKAEEAFIKWAVSTEARWVKGGGLLPTYPTPSSLALLRNQSPVNYLSYEELLKYGHAEPTIATFDQVMSQAVTPMLEKVVTSGGNVANLARAAQGQAGRV